MSKKQNPKDKFPAVQYAVFEKDGGDEYMVSCDTLEQCFRVVDKDEQFVGVYRLEKVIEVKREIVIKTK